MIDWGVFFDPTARIFYNIIYFAVIIGMIIIVISDNRNPVTYCTKLAYGWVNHTGCIGSSQACASKHIGPRISGFKLSLNL